MIPSWTGRVPLAVTLAVNRHGATTARHHRAAGLCRGYSLVEVLVALLVLSIGAFACMSMQLAALRMARDAAWQAEAARLAAEMAETLLPGGQGASASLPDVDMEAGDKLPPLEATCYLDACSPQQMRDAEFHDWMRRLRAALPQARIRICVDNAGDGQAASGKPAWNCGTPDHASAVLAVKIGWPSPDADEGEGSGRAGAAGFPPRVVFYVPQASS